MKQNRSSDTSVKEKQPANTAFFDHASVFPQKVPDASSIQRIADNTSNSAYATSGAATKPKAVKQRTSKPGIQRSGMLIGGAIGGGLGALLGAAIGSVGGVTGAVLGGLGGLLVGGLLGGIAGHFLADESKIKAESGNTQIIEELVRLSQSKANGPTAKNVMKILDKLSDNRLRVVIRGLIDQKAYKLFIENIVAPVKGDFKDLVANITFLRKEQDDPTQGTTKATKEQKKEVKKILDRGMSTGSSGKIAPFKEKVTHEETVKGKKVKKERTFYQNVQETLDREVGALLPRAQKRDKWARHKWPRYEEIAAEAKRVTDALYGHYATSTELKGTGPVGKRNLFDVRDQTYNDTDLAHFANYLVTGRKPAKPYYPGTTILAKHNADLTRSKEAGILATAIKDYIKNAANQKKLLLVRRNWSGAQRGGKIFLQRWKVNDKKKQRWLFWRSFKTMIHEYLHKVTHNNYKTATAENKIGRRRQQIFTEGGTSYFDRNVWKTVWPDEIANNKDLRKKVEGGEFSYDPAVIPPWTGYDQVVQFGDIVDKVGEANARAAYFKGEVEKIGL